MVKAVINKKAESKILYGIYAAICGLIPLAYGVLSAAVVYNGWRHFYFVYASMILFAAFGVYFVYNVKSQRYLNNISNDYQEIINRINPNPINGVYDYSFDHDDLYIVYSVAFFNAWSISAIMSSTFSIPTDILMKSGVTPVDNCSSGEIAEWVVEAGCTTKVFASQILAK